MKALSFRRWAYASVGLCWLFCSIPAAATPGNDDESAKLDPVKLLADATKVRQDGCSPGPDQDAIACVDVPALVDNLNAVGEFLGAAVACAALQSRDVLPAPALLACANAETRLGAGSAASRYLDRYVDEASDDGDALDRTMKAADILISGTRYRDAAPYLDGAARLAARVDPARSTAVSRAIFINCLNCGDVSRAGRVARELGKDNVEWIIGEYTARGLAKQAIEPVRVMVSDGIDSFDELGVAVTVYSALAMSAEAGSAALSCLNRCPGADTMSVASLLARGGMGAEAAAFAARNRSRFAVPADADLEIGFLLLAAGQVEKGAGILTEWAIPSDARVPADVDYTARQVRVEKRLLSEGRFDTAAMFGAAVRKAGGVFPRDVAPDMVSALVKAGKPDEAIAAAKEILAAEKGCSPLRYRLSAQFYAAGEFESSLSLVEPCRGAAISTDGDPFLPARVHLLRARLIRGGYLAGSVSGELVSAFEAAGNDRHLVETIDAFASTLGKDSELELVSARSFVRVAPDDPEAHNRLGMASVAAGDEEAAVASFQKAVELQKPGAADLSVAIDALLGAGFVNGAVGLFLKWMNVDNVSPSLAYRIGLVCIESGDRECVAIFVNRFLDGPVSDDVNYYELSDKLLSAGWLRLAGRTLDVAAKANPWDRSAREPWLRGRLALMSGDVREAQAQYEKAVETAATSGLIVMAISGDYARAGRISESVRWLQKGVQDQSPDVRAQVFPMWVDTLRRLGRASEITLDPLEGVDMASPDDWERAIAQLETCGRADLAIDLVNRVKENVRAADLGPLLVRLTALHCAARDRDGALASAGAACGWAVSFGGDHCVQAAVQLVSSGLGLDGLAAAGEFGPAATAGLSASGIASLVAITLREKGVKQALAAAALMTPSVYLESSSVSALMQSLQDAAGARAWDSFLSEVSARPEMSRDGHVLLDAALAAFAAGDHARGRDLVARYMDSPAGDRLAAVMALISDGRFDEAEALLKSAPDKFWASVDDEQLGRITSAYLLRGFPEGCERAFSRFISANGSSVASRQAVSRIRLALGDWRGAVRDITALPESSLEPETRVAFGFALWRADDRDAAMQQFRKVTESAADDDRTAPARYRVVGILDGQAGSGRELADLLGTDGSNISSDPAMIMATALLNLSVQDDQHLAAARKGLFRLLRTSRSVSALSDSDDAVNIREYVTGEARRETASDLARVALQMRGAAFAQTAMYAACIAGDEQTYRLAKERLFPGRLLSGGPDEVADPADLLSAAGISFACGRFNEALDLSLRYVRGGHVDSDGMLEAIIIAVKASAATGRKGAVTPAFVASLTDDLLLRATFVSTAASTAGNGRDVVESLAQLLPLMPGEQSLVMETIAARLSAGQDEGLAKYAFDLASALPDQSTVYHAVYGLMSAFFRFEEAARFAKMALDASPDKPQAEVDLYTALMDVGDTQGALQVADEVLLRSGGSSGTIMGLLGAAARAGRLPVVLSLVEKVTGDTRGAYTSTLPPAQAGVALRVVQFLDAARPGEPEAARFLDKLWDWSTDRQYFCAMAVNSLVDAWHEPGDRYVQNVSRLFADGRCASVESTARLRDTVAALSGGAVESTTFRASWSIDDLQRLVMAAVSTAILQGRVDDALSWLDGSSVPGLTAAERIRIFMQATDFLNDRPGIGAADIAKFADSGLRFVRKHAGNDSRYAMALATFVSLSQDVKAFTAFMDREIAVDPSSEHNRNMIAYSLSIRGKEQARFRKEVRLAVALGGADRGGYLETEAWGEFVFGGGARAVKMQRAASSYWSTTDFSTGLPECFNHFGTMLDSVGRDAEAVEMYRRSLMTSDGWDWHAILSARRLGEMGFFKTGTGD